MRIKLMVGLGVVALASLAAGCSDSGTTSGTNANTTTVATTTNTTTTAQTRSAPGDSEITTTTDQTGSTVETRTFKNNTAFPGSSSRRRAKASVRPAFILSRASPGICLKTE